MKLTYADYTDVGGRKNNEDSYAVAFGDHGYLFLVADGLGGHDNGEEASQIAVDEIKSRFISEGASFDPEAAIASANRRILSKQAEGGSGMKTTITLAWVGKGVTRFSHVGDSRIYAFNGNGIVYQSPDHSVSQMAVAVGEITVAEIRHHVDRNKLTKALGVDSEVKPYSYQLSNSEYEGLLLCSDGFWEYVLEDEMCALFKATSTSSDWLYEMRKLVSSRVPQNNDNNTAVAVFKKTDECFPAETDCVTVPAYNHIDDRQRKKEKKVFITLSVITAALLVIVITLVCLLVFGGKDGGEKDGGAPSDESAEVLLSSEYSHGDITSEEEAFSEETSSGESLDTTVSEETSVDDSTSEEQSTHAGKAGLVTWLEDILSALGIEAE